MKKEIVIGLSITFIGIFVFTPISNMIYKTNTPAIKKNESFNMQKDKEVLITKTQKIKEKSNYYLPTNKVSEIVDGKFFIHISVPTYQGEFFQYVNFSISSIGKKEIVFKKQKIGAILKYDNYEFRFINFENMYVNLKIVKVSDIKHKEKYIPDRAMIKSLISSLHELENNLVTLDSLSAMYNKRITVKSKKIISYSKTYDFFTYYFDLIFPLTYGEEKNLIGFLKELKEYEDSLNTLKTKINIINFNKSNNLSVDDIRLLTGFFTFYLDGIIKTYLPKSFSYTYYIGTQIYYEKNDTLVMNQFNLDNKPVKEYSTVLGLLD